MRKKQLWGTFVVYGSIVFFTLIIAQITGKATTVIVQHIPLTRKNTIVIDAGHGGVDGGATSCTGVLESKLNLDISIKLRDVFHLVGFNTKMIRTDDVSIHTSGDSIAAIKVSDLRNRVRIVNETENAVLISIHQNTFPDSQYRGAQVFYSQEGTALAQLMQESLIEYINRGSNRRSKKADGIYLMQHLDKVGILIECGFLSNPEEEGRLRSEAYQKKLSSIIAVTTAQFLTK